MALTWLALAGFRSYPQLRWGPAPEINLLVGPNGVGKTNLLEAVGFLFTASSFRKASDVAMVAGDREMASVRGEMGADTPHTVEMLLHRRDRRRVLLNGARLSRMTELQKVGRMLAFVPEHLGLVKGGPARRREWLDETAALLRPAAQADQSEYQKALRQRNAFLKSGDRDDLITLEVWDHRTALSGARVMAARARAFCEVRAFLADAVAAIAGIDERISIDYRSAWGGALDAGVEASSWQERLQAALVHSRTTDFRVGATTVGPHRDEPVVTLNGFDARTYASQGEQRTLALALRLGAYQPVEKAAGSRPVLVLDDVFSELDEQRGQALVEWLPATQIFISAVDEQRAPVGGKVWRVSPGKVT